MDLKIDSTISSASSVRPKTVKRRCSSCWRRSGSSTHWAALLPRTPIRAKISRSSLVELLHAAMLVHVDSVFGYSRPALIVVWPRPFNSCSTYQLFFNVDLKSLTLFAVKPSSCCPLFLYHSMTSWSTAIDAHRCIILHVYTAIHVYMYTKRLRGWRCYLKFSCWLLHFCNCLSFAPYFDLNNHGLLYSFTFVRLTWIVSSSTFIGFHKVGYLVRFLSFQMV